MGGHHAAMLIPAPAESLKPDVVPLIQAEAAGVTAHCTTCASHPGPGQPAGPRGSHSQAASLFQEQNLSTEARQNHFWDYGVR